MMTSTVRNSREAQHTAMTVTSPDHQLSSGGHEVELGAERDESSLSVPCMSQWTVMVTARVASLPSVAQAL